MPTANSPRIPKETIIIGGSLSSLMHGIMLHRLGSNVRILEQSPTSSPTSHMAGVCAGPDVLRFLERFDGLAALPLGIRSECLQSIDARNRLAVFLRAHRLMTSWDALYFRLRANFDRLKSAYHPDPPRGGTAVGGGPTAVYDVGKQVEVVEEVAGGVRVVYRDVVAGTRGEVVAGLVLGADGPNSVVRKSFLGPGIAERRYSGYLAWRGVVPEDEVSEEARKTFSANITYSFVEGGHVIVYNIPGELGSLDEGRRLLNFCWYTNQPTGHGLSDIMTDSDGIEHHTSNPAGKVRPEIWARQRAIAHRIFRHQAYLEMLDKIDSPFVHLITDYCAPRTTFAGGKVLLVGDSVALLRPHIAFSTNQAAWQCMMVERMLKGELEVREYDRQVSNFIYMHWCRSVWFGEWFQGKWYTRVGAAVRYWAVRAVVGVKVWMGRMPPLTW